MIKHLLGLCTLAASATTVFAQSSVTLYGVAEAGLLYSNNSGGASLAMLNSGSIQGSRWGLRGAEDLGGGKKAVFNLENGFSVANGHQGQGNAEFGRQAYVGLSSNNVGMLTLGRQYDSVVDYTGPFEAGDQWATYFGAHPGDLDNMNNANRTNNAIKYTSPTRSGVTFGGVYSLGGVAGQTSQNQIWSAGVGYNQGPIALGVAFLDVKDPNYSFFGNNPTSSTTASNMAASTVYSGYASAKTQQVIAAGGAYTVGAATIGATYSNTAFKDLGAEAGLNPLGYRGSARFNNAEVNFKYLVTPSLLLGLAYDYTKGYGVNDATYHQVMAGADYFLSKRTDVYIAWVYQHASGTDSTGSPAHANVTGLTASSTAMQTALLSGLRVKF